MTVKACYDRMGANYADVINRFKNDKSIIKYLSMLYQDDNFPMLCKALEDEDYEDAFRAAHTIKSIVLSMGLTRLIETSSELSETLRGRRYNDDVPRLFEDTKQAYQEMMVVVGDLLGTGVAGEVL